MPVRVFILHVGFQQGFKVCVIVSLRIKRHTYTEALLISCDVYGSSSVSACD